MEVLLNANMQYNFNSNHVNNCAQLSIPAVYLMNFAILCINVVYYIGDSKRRDTLYVFLCFCHSFYCRKHIPIINSKEGFWYRIGSSLQTTNDCEGGGGQM